MQEEVIHYKSKDFKQLNKDIRKEQKINNKRNGITKPKKNIFVIISTIFLAFAVLGGGISGVVLTVNGIQTANLGHYEDRQYVNDRIPLSQLLSKHSGTAYYVYIYKSDCTACDKLEKDVLKYIKSGPRPLYLLDGDKYESSLIEFDSSGSAISNYDITNANDLRCPSFPCLLLIQEGSISAHVIGQSYISAQLNAR